MTSKAAFPQVKYAVQEEFETLRQGNFENVIKYVWNGC